MRSTNSRCSSCNDETLFVISPEIGHFSVDVVKSWAAETLFREEGKIVDSDSLSLEKTIEILHHYKFAKISRNHR